MYCKLIGLCFSGENHSERRVTTVPYVDFTPRGVERSLAYTVLLRGKFMVVCDVKVTNENGVVAGNMMIKAKSTIMKDQRDVTDGMQSPWNLLLTCFENFQKWLQLRRKLRTRCCLLLGSVCIQVPARTLVME